MEGQGELEKGKQPAAGDYPDLPATMLITATPPVAVIILRVWLVPEVAGHDGGDKEPHDAPFIPIMSWSVPCAASPGVVEVASPVSVTLDGTMQNAVGLHAPAAAVEHGSAAAPEALGVPVVAKVRVAEAGTIAKHPPSAWVVGTVRSASYATRGPATVPHSFSCVPSRYTLLKVTVELPTFWRNTSST